MTDSVMQFYDQLADHYTLIFEDWQASVQRQANILERFLRALGFPPPATVLDCTCGIGTQAIGLASRGYQVYATDLSPVSIDKAREYAAQFGVQVQFAPTDVREVASRVEGQFDVVASFDNALPHLIEDEDLRLAVDNIYAKVHPNGLFAASIRDYDYYVQEKPHAIEPRVYDSPGERRIVFQVWDWSADGKTYKLQHFIVRGDGQTWQTTFGETIYRALLRDELSRFLSDAGFNDIRWHMPQDTGNYQPIVTAKRG